MNLIIDAGNTLVKFAVFSKGDIIFRKETLVDEVLDEAKKICDTHPQISWCIFSSVNSLDEKIIPLLSVFCKVVHLDATTPTPFKNSYASPQSLGVDRIALASGAFYEYPKKNVLAIDAGTCVTYDLLNDYGEYLGGAISPGIRMRYKALHKQTARLPFLEKEALLDFIGNTSETSIHSGVINGLVYEIDGFISQYKARFVDLTVILTGGDAQFLSKRLKNTIFADSNFLLKGLNYLLEYNKR